MKMRTDLEDFSGVHVLRGRNYSRIEGWPSSGAPSRDDVVVSGFEGGDELTCGPVQNHAPTDLAGVDQDLARAAADRQTHQRTFVRRIHVPVVGRKHLKVPTNLSTLYIESEDAIGVQRIAVTA